MNRTFLIFLMVGTAMMIAVLGQYKPHTQLDYTPWDIHIQDNGASRVFGLTLGKSNIQEANQIFASFAETRLVIDQDDMAMLVAHYNELVMDGIVADLYLYYQLEQATLQQLRSDLVTSDVSGQSQKTYTLPADVEMDYLSTPISRIVYKPAIQYGEELITQRFGTPQQIVKINDLQRHWHYPESGLVIRLFDHQPEEFEYRPLSQRQL
jgi:hypothetical protein